MAKEFYVLKIDDGCYWSGWRGTKNPLHALEFASVEAAKEYINEHTYELSNIVPSVVKIKMTVEEV